MKIKFPKKKLSFFNSENVIVSDDDKRKAFSPSRDSNSGNTYLTLTKQFVAALNHSAIRTAKLRASFRSIILIVDDVNLVNG